MHRYKSWVLPVGVVLLAMPATPTLAEIITISGSAQAAVQEFRSGQPGDTDEASDSYPATSTLPVQVVARLLVEGDDGAAASVAAQFADPRDLPQHNPEEFAINLALLSVSENIRYTAQATTQEVRGVVFRPADFPGRQAGETVSLIGQLHVDGALVVFSPSAGRDLTGASVYLRITVVKEVEGSEDQTLLTGRIGLLGGENGAVTNSAEGDFPTATLVRSNLAAVIDDFDLFEVLIIPRLTINYDYQATLDESFTLRVTVTVDAANAENQVGVAAIVGTPVDMIQEVISAAQGELNANKIISALEQERVNPTGTIAFATARPMLPLCGLLGFEFILGLAALTGLRCRRWPRRRFLAE